MKLFLTWCTPSGREPSKKKKQRKKKLFLKEEIESLSIFGLIVSPFHTLVSEIQLTPGVIRITRAEEDRWADRAAPFHRRSVRRVNELFTMISFWGLLYVLLRPTTAERPLFFLYVHVYFILFYSFL